MRCRRFHLQPVALAVGLAIGPAQAANTAGLEAPVASQDYEERLIDGGNLEPDSWSGDVQQRNAHGWPRSLRLDGVYSQVSSNGVESSNFGVGLSGMLMTPTYGAWSIDALYNRQAAQQYGTWFGAAGQQYASDQTSSVVTIWQRDMPFDGGWRASNGLGMLNTPLMDLARYQPRWMMPTTPMIGVSSEWRDRGGTQFTAATGEPGVYTGSYVPGFRRLGGQVSTLSTQWTVDRNWSVGAQYVGARDVTTFNMPLVPGDPAGPAFSTRSGLLSAGWQDGGHRAQVNLLQSGNSVTDRHSGVWADALVVDGRTAHSFGAFHMGPDLAWANQPVGTHARGAYYRINFANRQWLWDAYVDYSVPLGSSELPVATYGSGSVRYQVRRDLGVGGGGTARYAAGTAWSAFAYVENQHPLLVNRTQVSTGEASGRNEVAVSANQTWSLPAGTRLSTTVAAGRYSGAGAGDAAASNQVGLAASGGGDLAPNFGLDLNLQWIRATGEVEPTTLTGNLSVNWRFLPELALIATAYRSQVRTRGSYSPFQAGSVASPLDLQNQLTQVNERGLYLTLRYEQRAGSMSAPLGGAPGAGGGTVAGYVFLDGNEDGRFTALESGVPNVTVILDGKFSVRTDTNGRFEFPFVAAGRHVITAQPDNVPLAWQLLNDGRWPVEVTVRGSSVVEIPAQRIRQ